MACCKVCCGCKVCDEGEEGKCCCGTGSAGECCQAGEYCCAGTCEPSPCCNGDDSCPPGECCNGSTERPGPGSCGPCEECTDDEDCFASGREYCCDGVCSDEPCEECDGYCKFQSRPDGPGQTWEWGVDPDSPPEDTIACSECEPDCADQQQSPCWACGDPYEACGDPETRQYEYCITPCVFQDNPLP